MMDKYARAKWSCRSCGRRERFKRRAIVQAVKGCPRCGGEVWVDPLVERQAAVAALARDAAGQDGG